MTRTLALAAMSIVGPAFARNGDAGKTVTDVCSRCAAHVAVTSKNPNVFEKTAWAVIREVSE